MKGMVAFVFLVASACTVLPAAHASQVSPIEKIFQLIGDLQAKIIGEGTEAHKTYTEFAEWCDDRSKNLALDIKSAKKEVADLMAAMDEETSIIDSLTSKVEELSASIATDEKDLKAATDIREKEQAVFLKEEKELVDVSESLSGAARIIEEQMQKGGASMLQEKNAAGIARALSTLVQASTLSSADAKQLVAMLQDSQGAANGEAEEGSGAPDVAAYESHSGGILGTLEDLLEKAQEQLGALRGAEGANVHNFGMLKQSLDDEIKYAKKELAEAKQGIAQSSEKKATAEGDLEATSKDLKEDETASADLHKTCMTKAEDYEAEIKSRDEELKALAAAKKVLDETVGGASKQSYGLVQESFLQLTRMRLSSRSDLKAYEASRFVRDLAIKHKSPALAQLATRMASVERLSSRSGDDTFTKIKGLIADMIQKLEEEAEEDATHKAYCDKELGESNAKKEDKTNVIKKLGNKIEQMSSRSSQLKSQVSELQKSLSMLTKAQAEMDKLRQEENADFKKASAEMEQGVKGVKKALQVLREYYENKSSGAGDGIIGMLEVVESDFSKGLTEMTATEDAAQAEYDKETKENEIEKVTKEKDVKYKSEEATKLDEAVAETTSDMKGEQAELDAVNEYLKTLEAKCIAKPEGFAERIERMHQEIDGLKEALKILEGEAVLLQKTTKRALRAGKLHMA